MAEIEKCNKCGKEYSITFIHYPSKIDDNRDSYYECPNCHDIFAIHLKGNEDVETNKIIK